MGWDFDHPTWLLLLPLVVLPLLRRRSDTLVFPSLAALPPDPLGRLLGALWRVFAVGAMLFTVIGMAGPGDAGTEVLRTGRGAELLVLMDRSSSMDAVVHLNGAAGNAAFSVTESKAAIVRRLLGEFVAKRPDDRFAFMTFSTSAMPAVPFTAKRNMVDAALAAAGVGRGLPETRMGSALLAAIAQFEGRPYAGSRIVLLVSDGGAQLDAPTRQRVEAGLAQQKIGLYWIYIRSGPNAPSLVGNTASAPAGSYESVDELALHQFFSSLRTPYRLFQTDDAAAMGAAMAEIDRQQNFPVSFHERVPRRDFSGAFYLAALLCALALWGSLSLQWHHWPVALEAAA